MTLVEYTSTEAEMEYSTAAKSHHSPMKTAVNRFNIKDSIR